VYPFLPVYPPVAGRKVCRELTLKTIPTKNSKNKNLIIK